MTIPEPPPLPPEPAVQEMSVAELKAFVEGRDVYRAKAVFELAARAGTDDAAVAVLGDLSRQPLMRHDRLFHWASLAWAAIIGLLAADTATSRRTAYEAFADLDPADQENLLTYLKVSRIEDAHPSLL
jgi:hypothetical protein